MKNLCNQFYTKTLLTAFALLILSIDAFSGSLGCEADMVATQPKLNGALSGISTRGMTKTDIRELQIISNAFEAIKYDKAPALYQNLNRDSLVVSRLEMNVYKMADLDLYSEMSDRFDGVIDDENEENFRGVVTLPRLVLNLKGSDKKTLDHVTSQQIYFNETNSYDRLVGERIRVPVEVRTTFHDGDAFVANYVVEASERTSVRKALLYTNSEITYLLIYERNRDEKWVLIGRGSAPADIP